MTVLGHPVWTFPSPDAGAAPEILRRARRAYTLAMAGLFTRSGRIWGKSQVGEGSTFTFTLPLRRPEAS